MTSESQLRRLYAISLSTRPGDTLEAAARRALTAYVEQLPCTVGVLFEATGSGYRRVGAAGADPGVARQALDTLSTAAPLPQTGSIDRESPFYILDVPDFGVLVLVTDTPLDEELVAELGPLTEQLAAVCHGSEGGHRGTVERFYDEIERIFAADSREEICKLAMAATDELVGSPNASIHRYDRATETLTPVAATIDRSFERGPASYTDRGTVVWEVYHSGESVVIDDTSAFDDTLPHSDTPVDSAAILPLGDHGVLTVSAFETAAFDGTDLSLLRLLCRIVEVALDRHERIERLEGVQEITRAAVEGQSHEAIAADVLERVPDVLDFPISGIWKYEATTDTLRPIAATAKAADLFPEMPSFSGGDSLIWRAFQNSETYSVSDVDSRGNIYNEDTPIGSEIIVPIGTFGVLVTGSTHAESFSAAERQLVETLAANIETAMRLADRRQELELLDQVLARILRHNIRNELNIIQGYATQIFETDTGDAAALAEKIIEGCDDLETTAAHAREMQEVVRTRDSKTSVELREVIAETAELVRLEHPAAQITTELAADPTIVAHPELPTALRHLLENSIEHHDEGADSAVVRSSLSLAEDGDPVVEIADNGPGIPETEIDILDRHGESALEHGSGAGLWLVNRVVEYSGGTLTFENTADGAVVRLRFES